MRLVAIGLCVFLSVSPLAASASDDDLPEYTGPEFQELYDYAVGNTLPGLGPPPGVSVVTGNEDLDSRLWDRAVARGYRLRPTAVGSLARVDGVDMQPAAAAAWQGLREEAREAGMRFIVSSAYRSPASQRSKFLRELEGTSDRAIDATLTWYSLPGTSKHHGGYALDFRYSGGTFGEFRSTPDYLWLAADNFAVPKRHGFVPSYPDDGLAEGPNPEPWEFVWVGLDLVECGVPQRVATGIAGPASAVAHEIGSCPGGPGPAGLPGWLAG